MNSKIKGIRYFSGMTLVSAISVSAVSKRVGLSLIERECFAHSRLEEAYWLGLERIGLGLPEGGHDLAARAGRVYAHILQVGRKDATTIAFTREALRSRNPGDRALAGTLLAMCATLGRMTRLGALGQANKIYRGAHGAERSYWRVVVKVLGAQKVDTARGRNEASYY
jgi:hypothetical protein